jgi:hypothetical protein
MVHDVVEGSGMVESAVWISTKDEQCIVRAFELEIGELLVS